MRQKTRSSGLNISPDKRGGRNNTVSKTIAPEIEKSVVEHVNLHPRVESHYLRA